MPAIGEILSLRRFDDDTSGLTLDGSDQFGCSIDYIGDMSGDGTTALIIGSLGGDNNYGSIRPGHVRIVFLNQDGSFNRDVLWNAHDGVNQQWNMEFGRAVSYLGQHTAQSSTFPQHLFAVGSPDSQMTGAAAAPSEGQVFFMPVNSSATEGIWVEKFDDYDGYLAFQDNEDFGHSIEWCGHVLQQQNNAEPAELGLLCVGSPTFDPAVPPVDAVDEGCVRLIYYEQGGSSVAANKYIIDSTTTNGPTIADGDLFGSAIAHLGTHSGGDEMIAVGAPGESSGGTDRGAIHIIYLDPAHDGTVNSTVTLKYDTTGMPTLSDDDNFGYSLAMLGDISGDGTICIAVGAPYTGGTDKGRVYLLFIDEDGVIDRYLTIDHTSAVNPPNIPDGSLFGYSVRGVPNLRRDGRTWLAVGAPLDDGVNVFTSDGCVWLIELETRAVQQTIEIPIVSDADDYYIDHVPSSTDNDDLIVGDVAGNKREPYLIFRDSMIPPDVLIDEAVLRMYATAVTANTKYRFETEYPVGTVVATSTDHTTTPVVSVYQNTPDLSAEFQAVVDDAAYDTGDDFAILMKVASSLGGVTSTFNSHAVTEGSSTARYSPRLRVSYTPPLLGSGLEVDSVQSGTEVSPTNVKKSVPLTVDSVQSAAQASSVNVPTDEIPTDNSQSSTEVSSPTLSVEYGLTVDSTESQPEVEEFWMGLPTDNVESGSEVEPIAGLDGHLELEVDSVESASQTEEPDVEHIIKLTVDSVESQPEVLEFNTSMDVISSTEVSEPTLQAKGPCIQLCTPPGKPREVTQRGVAVDFILAGQVVRDVRSAISLASNTTYDESQYSGIAITNANPGDHVSYVENGDIRIPGIVFEVNVVYCLDANARYKRLQDIVAGEYISILGIAIDSDMLRMGVHFTQEELENVSTNAPASTLVVVDSDEVKLGPSPTGNEEIPYFDGGPVAETITQGDSVWSAAAGISLTDADAEDSSNFLGIAITCAAPGCNVSVLTDGDIVLSDADVPCMTPNMVYVVANDSGKLMPVTEAKQGDFITFVGIATTDIILAVGQIYKGILAV